MSQRIVKVGIQIQQRANMKKEIGNANNNLTSKLDELISTCMQSGLTIIGGRPGTGKTSLLLDIVSRALLKNPPTPTLLFSLEMTKEQTVSRLLKVKGDAYQEENLEFLHVEDSHLHADVIHLPSILDISSKIKALNNSLDKKLGLIVIDCLQLINNVNKNNPRKEEVAEILKTLKNLAKDLNVPIISSAMLKRDEGVKPSVADFREVDNIEQYADNIVLLYRIIHADFYKNKKMARSMYLNLNKTFGTFENIE